MADCVVVPSVANVRSRKSYDAGNVFFHRNSCRGTKRESCGKGYSDIKFRPSVACLANGPISNVFRRNKRIKHISFKCCCPGALIDPESLLPDNWVPIVDQGLLTVSMALAYLAGIIPQDRKFSRSKENTKEREQNEASSKSYARSADAASNDYWSGTKEKLLDALSAIQSDATLVDKVAEVESHNRKQPMSIFAVDQGPRLRLILFTLQRLEKEINGFSQALEFSSRDMWLKVALEAITRIVVPVCTEWIEAESNLSTGEINMGMKSKILGKLNDDDRVLQNITRSGKTELYADLTFFLRFDYLRFFITIEDSCVKFGT